MDPDLFAYLETYLTEPRKARLREVLALRTRWITLVLDDIYQPHNISAALRSCDAFGIQDVHLVESRHDLQLSSDVAAGSDKWLSIHRHRGPGAAKECADALRRSGFRIVVTQARDAATTPLTLDLAAPVAIVIGNETTGVSEELAASADERLTIPMYGFVESYNLSVAAALCLQDLTRRVRAESAEWRLSSTEQQELLFKWTRSSIANVEAIEARWRSEASRPDSSEARGISTNSSQLPRLPDS